MLLAPLTGSLLSNQCTRMERCWHISTFVISAPIFGNALAIGSILRPAAPTPCQCPADEELLETGDHSRCGVELLVCAAHKEAHDAEMRAASEEFNRKVAEAGLTDKFRLAELLPPCPAKSELIRELTLWMFNH